MRKVSLPPPTDAGLAAVLLAWVEAAVWFPGDAASTPVAGPFWLRVAYPLLVAVPLAWRRVAPLAVAATVMLGVVLQAAVTLDSPEGLWLIVVLSLVGYSVAAFSPRRRAVIGLGIAVVGYLLYAWGDPTVRQWRDGDPWAAGFFGAMVVAWWLFGLFVRHRHEERRAHARADELREQARVAVDQERARLARELHDVISHNLSVVVVQAAGARATGTGDPATLEKIERSGRESLVEMRRLLGVLRTEGDGDPDLAPQPGIGQLDALAAGVRAAGLDVTLTMEGERAALSPVLDLCAYRIVQESLTNVVKHAGPARVGVTVRCDPRAVTIDVVDDGVGSPVVAGTGHGHGHGLVGMRERVALFGGSLTVGPLAGGGFGVHARLPRDDVAVSESP
jgi:signal transduction histidine kinase